MQKIKCVESICENSVNQSATFIIEPLEIGQGITIGNTIRRTLLSDLIGFGISGVRINNIKHEFAVLPYLREDILEILLNLKQIIFKKDSNITNLTNFKAFLNIKGPKIVTASMFRFPKNSIEILNPNQYICTIIDNSELFIEIDIESGKGYRSSQENFEKKMKKILNPLEPVTLPIDSLFMPIKRVNYKIKLIHDTKGNIKESLIIEIITNGSITPKRALNEATKHILKTFTNLFLSIQSDEFLELNKLLKNKI